MSVAGSWEIASAASASADLFIDHIEMYVTDLGEAREMFTEGYGFDIYAPGVVGPEGSVPRGLALGRGEIRLLLTEASGDDHPSSGYVDRHGDGVAVIALGTADARGAFTDAVRRGAVPVREPAEHDGVITASIRAFGDVVHTFVQRPEDAASRIRPWPAPGAVVPAAFESGLRAVDHIAVCLEAGQLDSVVGFYVDVLDFRTIFEERISVGSQAMNSTVVQSASGAITLTMLEPDPTREPGQIDDFIRNHDGPGVQHIAFRTDNIVRSVRIMRERGVAFLASPQTYYALLRQRLEPSRHSVDALRDHSVLVDEDHDGQLFQIFTRSVHPRNTLFMEVVERDGASTFGSGNIGALYEAVELHRAAGAARA
jgi:4-hydroxymandelate synthase